MPTALRDSQVQSLSSPPPATCKNVVTPKLEAEYLAVPLERKLSAHQDASEAKKFTVDPVYVELSIEESANSPRYATGAKFTCSPDNVEVFFDKKCEDKDKLPADGAITDKQLREKPKLQLWLRGKTAGKFTAKFTL